MKITFDTRDFDFKVKDFKRKFNFGTDRALFSITNEVLRLSSFEVPHDTGWLQGHGTTERVSSREHLVGYNTPYAARLHEHPEYHFKKGRKGKYLEDPIKNNMSTLGRYFTNEVKESLHG